MLAIAGGLDRAQFSPRILVAGGSQAFAAHVPVDLPCEIGPAQRLRDGLPWLIRRIRAIEPRVCISVMGYLNLMLLGARRLLPRSTRLVVREANTLASTTGALPKWLPGPFLYKSLYPRADAIVSPSDPIAKELLTLCPRLDGRIAVIPNPVDVNVLRSRAMAPCREPGEGLRLVSVGRLTHQKGYDRLLAVFPQLPANARLIVFGKGEDQAGLEAQAEALGIGDRVRFAGFSLDVAQWIAGADAFVLPSRWEGLPNAVLESLALGTPAIVSDQAAVEGLARSAGPAAVRVAPVDHGFASLINRVEPAQARPAQPRPSLLPAEYELRSVLVRWTELLGKASGIPGVRRV